MWFLLKCWKCVIFTMQVWHVCMYLLAVVKVWQYEFWSKDACSLLFSMKLILMIHQWSKVLMKNKKQLVKNVFSFNSLCNWLHKVRIYTKIFMEFKYAVPNSAGIRSLAFYTFHWGAIFIAWIYKFLLVWINNLYDMLCLTRANIGIGQYGLI